MTQPNKPSNTPMCGVVRYRFPMQDFDGDTTVLHADDTTSPQPKYVQFQPARQRGTMTLLYIERDMADGTKQRHVLQVNSKGALRLVALDVTDAELRPKK